ncbi:MFS transporter, partial [Actinoplanes sp. NPDC048791]|uniref:MFS transporter n=1 Tax=Actinoplanes sp. NPDC048791 TaxID=3154623 RepID=UPI0033E569AA
MNALAPLRHAPFRFLLAGRTINSIGNAVAPVALAFAVLDLTGSPSDLGLVVGTRVSVNVLFVLFGGALADRMPKHHLMVGASIAAAVTQAAVAALVLSGAATIPWLIALSAVNGMVSALALPASSSIVPQLIPEEIRQQANALNRLFFNGAFIVGAPLGGILVAGVGPGWGIAVDAAAFALSAIAFALLRIPRPAPAATAPDQTVPAPGQAAPDQTVPAPGQAAPA